MKFNNLGKSGLKVSELCLGTMVLGSSTNEKDSISLIHRALSDGINFIDTANGYNNGLSEQIVGEAVNDRRNDVIITTKVNASMGSGPNDGGLSRHHILTEVENSLQRLQTNHIDLYMLHRPDPSTPLEESITVLNDLVRQGKVRYIGMSNHKSWEICSAIWMAELKNLTKVSAVQDLYNIVNRDIEVELLPFCKEYGLGVMAYSPLARGVMTGKYLPGKPIPTDSRAGQGDSRILESEMREHSLMVASKLSTISKSVGKSTSQIALNWVLINRAISSAIIGPRNLEQYEDNIGALGWNIPKPNLLEIDELVPPGEHTGIGFNDPMNPIKARFVD